MTDRRGGLGGARFRPAFGESSEDIGVNLVREFRHEREVVPAETVGVVKLLVVPEVGAGEGHVVEALVVCFVFPDCGFDAAEPESLNWSRGVGGFGFRSGGSVFRIHGFSFVVRSGIALSSRGGGAVSNEPLVGGIPSKEDPNECARAAAVGREGPPERARLLSRKNSRYKNMPARRATSSLVGSVSP